MQWPFVDGKNMVQRAIPWLTNLFNNHPVIAPDLIKIQDKTDRPNVSARYAKLINADNIQCNLTIARVTPTTPS